VKYLKIILPLILISGFFIHSNVYAYKYFWGLRVPTNFNEVQSTFSDFRNNYIGQVIPSAKTEVELDVSEEAIFPKDDLIEMEISEKELNVFLSRYAKGKKYQQFTLEEVNVRLVESQIIADVSINQINAKVTLKAIDNGTKLEIVDIDMGESGYLASIKSLIIKSAFKAIQPKIISEYLKDFDSLKIETGKITVFLKKQN